MNLELSAGHHCGASASSPHVGAPLIAYRAMRVLPKTETEGCLGGVSGHLGDGVHPAVFQVGRFMNGR